MLAEKGKARGGRAKPLRELGEHPDDGRPVAIYDGRYGPYVKHGRTNATIPGDRDLDALTLTDAVELIAARVAKGKKGKKAAPKKKAAAKKKPAAKKPAARKAAAKKPAKKSAAEKSPSPAEAS